MTDELTHYKWLTSDGRGSYGHGDYSAFKPNGKPGGWTPSITPRLCATGYHVCTADHLIAHARVGAELWVVETKGRADHGGDKSAFEQIRLVELVGVATSSLLIEFACDAAERVLPIFEARIPGDDRPRRAIIAARAARAAAAAAAADAARAAYADAARAAAAAAYADAADAAAAAAERRWQGDRLLALVTGSREAVPA
jgi:hypothetical protein